MGPQRLDTSGWQRRHGRVALWHGSLRLALAFLQPRHFPRSGDRRRQPQWWWPACRLLPRPSLPSGTLILTLTAATLSVAAATLTICVAAAALAAAALALAIWHRGVRGYERLLRGHLPRRVGRSVQ